MEGLYSAIQENTVPTLSPQHHQKEELGRDCVLLGLLSAEAVCVLGYAALPHSVQIPCCPNMMLKVPGIIKLSQI